MEDERRVRGHQLFHNAAQWWPELGVRAWTRPGVRVGSRSVVGTADMQDGSVQRIMAHTLCMARLHCRPYYVVHASSKLHDSVRSTSCGIKWRCIAH